MSEAAKRIRIELAPAIFGMSAEEIERVIELILTEANQDALRLAEAVLEKSVFTVRAWSDLRTLAKKIKGGV